MSQIYCSHTIYISVKAINLRKWLT